MQKRRLGQSDLEVSALGLGCMGMSFSYGVLANETAFLTSETIAPTQQGVIQINGRSWQIAALVSQSVAMIFQAGKAAGKHDKGALQRSPRNRPTTCVRPR